MWICNRLNVFRLLFFNANTINHIVRLLFYHGNEVLYFWLCIKDEDVTVFTMVLSNVHLQSQLKAIKFRKSVFSLFFKYIFYIKIWHAASNNRINLFKIIVINNRNYNLKGIIDNYDFCHNRAALRLII